MAMGGTRIWQQPILQVETHYSNRIKKCSVLIYRKRLTISERCMLCRAQLFRLWSSECHNGGRGGIGGGGGITNGARSVLLVIES